MENQKLFDDVKGIALENIGEYIQSLAGHSDYENDCINVAKAGLAAMYTMAREQGITGFQASMALMTLIREWEFSNNKTGFRLVNFDDFLYPQYSEKMRSIPKSVWTSMQKEAENNLRCYPDSHPNVLKHWAYITEGVVPFGYTISED